MNEVQDRDLQPVSSEGPRDEQDPIQLLAVVNTLLRRRWMIAMGAMALTVAVGAYTFTITPTYTAAAKFLPSRQTSISDRMSTAVAGAGSIDTAPDNTAPEYYIALLTSRPFLQAVIHRKFLVTDSGDGQPGMIELIDLLANKSREQSSTESMELEALLKMVTIIPGKSKSPVAAPIITVSVVSGEPQLSADIANAFVEELVKYNQGARTSKAKENLKFVEGRKLEGRDLLAKAEDALATFATRNRKIATPELQAEKDRLTRAVKVQEEVYTTLMRQYELAKIQEQEDQESIELIETAAPPLNRTAPNRTQSVMVAAFLGLVLFSGLALVLDYIKRIDRSDENTRQLFENLAGIKRDLTLGLSGRKT